MTAATDVDLSPDAVEWRAVVGCPAYEVAEDGRVRRRSGCREVPVWHRGDGSAVVSLHIGWTPERPSGVRRASLKRVVFEAWRNGGEPMPPQAAFFNINGDPDDCRACNLVAVTASEVRRRRHVERCAALERRRAETEEAAGPTDGRRNVAPHDGSTAWDKVERYDGVRRASTLAERLAAEERSRRCDSCSRYRGMGGWGTCTQGPRRCTTAPGARCAAWERRKVSPPKAEGDAS